MTQIVPKMPIILNVVMDSALNRTQMITLSQLALLKIFLMNVDQTQIKINVVMDQKLAAANAKLTRIVRTLLLQQLGFLYVAMVNVEIMSATMCQPALLILIALLTKLVISVVKEFVQTLMDLLFNQAPVLYENNISDSDIVNFPLIWTQNNILNFSLSSFYH